jgi:hypothetical protein
MHEYTRAGRKVKLVMITSKGMKFRPDVKKPFMRCLALAAAVAAASSSALALAAAAAASSTA